jgi:hypothetical protein
MMLFFGIVVCPDRFGDINNGALPVGITAPYPKFNHDFICMFDRIKLSIMIGKGALSQLSSGMVGFCFELLIKRGEIDVFDLGQLDHGL